MEKVHIIKSKLISPSPLSTYMHRSSFIKKMQIAASYRLTLIHSGPGFGKSLGLAQFLKDSNITYSWYSVTEEDDDVIPFISYLKASISQIIPEFGKSIPNLSDYSTFLKKDDLYQWLSHFINELCDITKPLTIVVDDFHLVDHVFQINFIMEKLIELIPPHVNLMVATRAYPKWSNLLRLRVKNQLFEVQEDDLVFSKEEINVYLEDYFSIQLEEKHAEEIADKTEGWAIAVNLLALTLSESKQSFENIMTPVFKNLFDYLSEEVFQGRTREERDWLLAFAIFPTFSVDLIHDFYDEEAENILYTLAKEHGFIQSLGEDTYRYHALFHSFLVNKWSQMNPDKFVVEHKRAADYFYQQGNLFQATYHAQQTKDDLFIGDILLHTASSLISAGQFDWFLEMYQALKASVRKRFYPLYNFEGDVLRYQAFYEQARQAYNTCIEIAEKQQDVYYLSRAYSGIANIFLDTIQPALAEKPLKKAIELAEKSEEMQTKEIDLLKRQFAENLVNLGRAKDAKRWVETEKLSADILREGNLDARILLRMGKLKEAEKVLLDHMEKKTVLPDSHRETEVLLSLIYCMLGKFDIAEKKAEQGIQIGKEVKSSFIEAVGYTRKGHCIALKNPYLLEEAEDLFKRAIHVMDKLNVSRVKAEPTMGLARVKARKGQFEEAIFYGESALLETEKVNDDWLSGLIRVSLAMMYFYQKDLDNSEYHIIKAKELFQAGGDMYGEMVALFWMMNIYFLAGNMEQLIKAAKSFSTICMKENYVFFLNQDTMFGAYDREMMYPLFEAVRKSEPNHRDIDAVIKEIKLVGYGNHPGYCLYATNFGRMELLRGVERVEEKQWKREKSKEMLLYFLLNRNRFIRKEEIMQALWDNTDEKTSVQHFKVTMNALLKVLEPNRKPRQPSFFILRKNSMYYLNPRTKLVNDVALFMEWADQGMEEDDMEMSLTLLLRAAHLFQGTPYEEWGDVQWIVKAREETLDTYIQIVEKLSQYYVRLEEYDKGIVWAEELLKIDPIWEEAYRLIMYCYYKMQNRPQAMKWYEKCVQILQEELNIEPLESTKNLAQKVKYDSIEVNDRY